MDIRMRKKLGDEIHLQKMENLIEEKERYVVKEKPIPVGKWRFIPVGN
jgi:hypothetical protein